MGKYFDTGWLKPITPVTNQIGTSSGDAAFGDKDIVWDWLAIDIPKGTHRLINASMIVQGTHGARQAEVDFQLWFARPVDGVAPPSLGTPNAVVSGTGHRKHMVGIVDFDATHAGGDCSPFNSFYSTGTVSRSGAATTTPGLIVAGDPTSGTNVGYDKLYVAAVSKGTHNWGASTVVSDGTQSTSSPTITVKTVSAVITCGPGDILRDEDGLLFGTVKTVDSATSITLEDNSASNTTDEKLVYNTTPITIVASFER